MVQNHKSKRANKKKTSTGSSDENIFQKFKSKKKRKLSLINVINDATNINIFSKKVNINDFPSKSESSSKKNGDEIINYRIGGLLIFTIF